MTENITYPHTWVVTMSTEGYCSLASILWPPTFLRPNVTIYVELLQYLNTFLLQVKILNIKYAK